MAVVFHKGSCFIMFNNAYNVKILKSVSDLVSWYSSRDATASKKFTGPIYLQFLKTKVKYFILYTYYSFIM